MQLRTKVSGCILPTIRTMAAHAGEAERTVCPHQNSNHKTKTKAFQVHLNDVDKVSELQIKRINAVNKSRNLLAKKP